MVAAGNRFARVSADPLPDLLPESLIRINDEMLADGLSDFVIDFEACWTVWDRMADKGDETALLGDGGQADDITVYWDVELRLVVVPPQVLTEESLEIE